MTGRFYNDTDNRQCSAVDEHGTDCSAPEGHTPPHVSARGEWYDDPLPYLCPHVTCLEEFATSDERADHLVNDHGEAHQ